VNSEVWRLGLRWLLGEEYKKSQESDSAQQWMNISGILFYILQKSFDRCNTDSREPS
jgi:hypothetical protein